MKNRTKFVKKIPGPNPNLIHEFALRPNKELYYKIENIKDTIKKKDVYSYGLIVRMDDSRLTKQIYNKLNKHKSKTT